jgi:hypothetical protein
MFILSIKLFIVSFHGKVGNTSRKQQPVNSTYGSVVSTAPTGTDIRKVTRQVIPAACLHTTRTPLGSQTDISASFVDLQRYSISNKNYLSAKLTLSTQATLLEIKNDFDFRREADEKHICY